MNPHLRNVLAAFGVATLGLVVVASRIDCGGTYPTLDGPGLTLDETFNVEQGVYLTAAMREYGLGLFTMSGATQVFDQAQYNPDHPPLGRLVLGIAHEAARAVSTGNATGRISVAAGRWGSALGFAATVFLVALSLARRVSLTAGIAAGLSLVMMPRVVGHAHLGSLETLIGFFYTATILTAARLVDNDRSATRVAVLTGLLLALALLTKIQAIFLPVAIIPWLLWSRKAGGVRLLLVVLATACACFLAFWPWLWLDPVAHISEYLGRTTDRTTVYNFYFGTRYGAPPPDASVPAVPWHYAIVTFLTTVPVGLLLLGALGAKTAASDRLRDRRGLILAGIAVPLLAFSVPSVPVYDGARLFLIVFPLWAMLAGIGFDVVWKRVRQRKSKWPARVLVTVFALQSVGLFISGPFFLGYHNLLLGGTRGASALGMETSYWGEGATTELWNQVPEGSTVYVTPVLDMYRLESLHKYMPVIAERRIQLKPFLYDLEEQPGLLLLLHRRADLPRWLDAWSETRKPLAQTTLQGVPLATLVHNDGTPFADQPRPD